MIFTRKQRKYLSDWAQSLEPWTPGELPRGRRYVKLNTNESPFSPAPGVITALQAEAAQLRLYPDPACIALRKSLAELHGIKPEQIFVGNGANEVLAFCFAAFFAGATVRGADISYAFFHTLARLSATTYQTAPVLSNFSIDPGSLCGGAGVVLANPNAPTSLALPPGALRHIAENCAAHGSVLLVDEAYINFGGESALPLLDTLDNVVAVRTFSKAYALAGQRVGYAMAHPALIEGLHKVQKSFNPHGVDRLAQATALAAISDTAYTERCVAAVRAARLDFSNGLQEMGFSVLPSDANFVFARHPNHQGEALQASLRGQGILVRRFSEPRIADWLRITIGNNEEMGKTLNALKSMM
ncbi:MAG: aminotransferase class I/II-fold pyridoxal phosphate-dependent enzyme [Clostridia bacterium]|nr:aminotransferase class I/II-fold pyridoxal phosphate-dependent enzyme [Clostridia bacterium]